MGIATKYVKDKGKNAAVGPGLEVASPADLLPIEHDFYANLNPQVLVGAERYTGDVAVLWARVQSLWRTLSIDRKAAADFFHDGFRGMYSGETFVHDKQTRISQICGPSRITSSVMLSARACEFRMNPRL